MTQNLFEQTAELIASADALLITAGAGMGVDSGLPDFRGAEGFWKAYPALAAAGVDFMSIANAHSFRKNPRQAWGFYGHRLALYRQTVPHAGFQILRRFAQRMPAGAFVITSNVDGQFQKAGFDESKILELHGSIHRMQCCAPCSEAIWSAKSIEPVTNDERCEWIGNTLPTCPKCRQLARPNILMFDDGLWINSRTALQRASWQVWSDDVRTKVVIELGAGIDIPSIRHIGNKQACPLIRINPRHTHLQEGGGIRLAMGAKEALSAIECELEKLGWL